MKVSAISTLATALLVSSAAAATNSSSSGSASAPTAGCSDVSVQHDATYCIEGPICSGSGLEPTGSNCPVQGDAATADCHDYLTSYGSEGSCVLPVDTTCQVIETGAWGCVLSSSSSSSGDSSYETGSSSGSAVDATVLVAEAAASAGGISAGVVGAIAAAAAAVAAVAGFALYKQHQKNSAEAAEVAHMHTFVDVVTP